MTIPPKYIEYRGCKYRLAEIKERSHEGHDITLMSEEGNPLEGELLVSVEYPDETRALYLDPVDGGFFAKFSSDKGDRVLELTKEDAKRFFLTLMREAGKPGITVEQAKEIWSPKSLPERTSSFRPRLYLGRVATVPSYREEQLQEKVDRIKGGFCYAPHFNVVGWKYEVPDNVVQTFVQRLTANVTDKYPHLDTLDISLGREPSANCLGGIFAFGGAREIRPVTTMLDKVVYLTWREVYAEFQDGNLVTGSSLGDKLRARLEEVRETGGDLTDDSNE